MKNIQHKQILGTFIFVLGLFFTTVPVHAVTVSPIRFELSGDAGTTVREEMTLINDSGVDETYYASFANFEAQGETGTPNFVTPNEGLGKWIMTDMTVTVEAGKTKIVPFQITIPKDQEPGGNFASIFWSTTPPTTKDGTVVIGGKTGILVLLSVNGETQKGGAILDYQTKDKKEYYTALPVSFTYRFQNTGTDRVKPAGSIVIKNIFGLKSALVPANVVEGNVLPKSIRKFETAWQKKTPASSPEVSVNRNFFDQAKFEWYNFAFGRYTATLDLKYGTEQNASSRVSFWVFPWQLLLILLVIFLIIFFVVKKILSSYNKWIISQAQKNIVRIMDEQHRNREASSDLTHSVKSHTTE